MANTSKKSLSEIFGVAICQVGLALAFVFYIFISSALLPIKAIEAGMPRYRLATAFEWGPPIILSLAAGCFLWVYRRKIFNSVYISLGLFLAALGAILFAVKYPVALVMLFCFAGSWSLLFDSVLPQSRKWKPSRLLLINLFLFFLGGCMGILAFSAVSTFVANN